jgi:hypothetical protein
MAFTAQGIGQGRHLLRNEPKSETMSLDGTGIRGMSGETVYLNLR